MIKNPNGIKRYLDLNPPIKYISLIENVFISCSKIESCIEIRNKYIAIVKVCFQPHVNVRKWCLPYGFLLNCFCSLKLIENILEKICLRHCRPEG